MLRRRSGLAFDDTPLAVNIFPLVEHMAGDVVIWLHHNEPPLKRQFRETDEGAGVGQEHSTIAGKVVGPYVPIGIYVGHNEHMLTELIDIAAHWLMAWLGACNGCQFEQAAACLAFVDLGVPAAVVAANASGS